MSEARFILEAGKGWEGVHQVADLGLPGECVLYADQPDFVVYPIDKVFGALAGRRGILKESSHQVVRCPICKEEGNRTIWRTEHGVEIILCACCKQYVWVKAKPKEEG